MRKNLEPLNAQQNFHPLSGQSPNHNRHRNLNLLRPTRTIKNEITITIMITIKTALLSLPTGLFSQRVQH